MAEYRFTEERSGATKVRLEWVEEGREKDALDFWIVDAAEVEKAKERVRAGEFAVG
jgi:hypothetical protein